MNSKTIRQLQDFIYNQMYAASAYKALATMTNDRYKKQRLLNFSVACSNTVSYLDRFYQYHATSSYNPLVEKPHLKGSFKQELLTMLEYEALSHYGFNNESYNPAASSEYQELLNYACNACNSRGLLLIHMYLTCT